MIRTLSILLLLIRKYSNWSQGLKENIQSENDQNFQKLTSNDRSRNLQNLSEISKTHIQTEVQTENN